MDYEVELAFVISKRGKHIKVLYIIFIIIIIMKVDEDRCIPQATILLCCPVQESEAMSHVAGYTVAHDVSARDWQMHKNGKQWLLGKTFDTFCPLGPALVTTSAISGAPHLL